MRNGVKKILKSRNTGTQIRLDSFFKVTTNSPTISPNKRKTDDVKEGDKKKAKKTAAGFKRPK